MIVFGIDIIKGSLSGKERPKYALVVVKDGEEELFKVTRNKLFRLIRERRPQIVAVDNIHELFKSKRELVNFLKEVPPSIKLVQVTGRESLPSLARRYGIHINIRNPLDEARACAHLASYGVGEEVSVFFDKTLITISRNRSLGKGGWHQNRYRRRVHDQVRMIFNEIKQILKNHNLEFSEDVRVGYGGISKGTLLVNAERCKVPVNSFKTKNVQVNVDAVEKDKIEFIPLGKSKKHLIVGVDPGSTVGIAILDLNGSILGVRSKKGWSFSEVIEYIHSFGQPVLIATDKSNPPDYVSKIKSTFNATLYTPRDDMSIERKITLTKDYKLLNDHERDALSSAIDAYNSYKSKLLNIEKRIPPGFDSDLAKAQIIRGLPLRSLFTEKTEHHDDEPKKHIETIDRTEIEKRDKIIEELSEENRILKKEIESLKNEIEKLRSKIVSISSEEHERLRKDNYIKNLQTENFRLRKEIEEKTKEIDEYRKKIDTIKRLRYLEIFEGWKWVKVLKKFTKEEIDRLEREFGINEGDVIFIQDCSGGGKITAEYLVKKGIKAIISRGLMSHLAESIFEKAEIPVLSDREVEMEYGDELILINSQKFEEIYSEKKRSMEKKKVELVEKLFEDYREKRKRMI